MGLKINNNKFQNNINTNDFPGWLYFFPVYVMVVIYALLGKTGYILVADNIDPQYALPKIPPPPISDYNLYYFLTYGILFPGVFLSQWLYFKLLSKRLKISWKNITHLFIFVVIGGLISNLLQR